MLRNSRGKQLWIVEEAGARTPVRTPGDISRRPRGRGKPDWWVEEREPGWTPEQPVSLMRLGMTQNDEAARRSSPRWLEGGFEGSFESGGTDFGPDTKIGGGPGAGMKIGAGHKPQAYDARGRYTGPGGGSISMRDGSISLFAAADGGGEEGGQDESQGGEPGAGAEAPEELAEQLAEQLENVAQAQEAYEPLPGVLLADSGRIGSDAGGGWSNEARRLEEKTYSPERLAQNAKADLGSDKWKPKEVNGEMKNQCNVFVASKLRESGAHVPNVGGKAGTFGEETSDYLAEKTGGAIGGQIPSANDWHKGVPGYERVKTENGERPMPGDVASNGTHVGIVSGDRKTISVTSRGDRAGHVVENDWGFREGQNDVTFWRHAGSRTTHTRTGS